MRLLFDENLSFRLPRMLDDLFAGSRHVEGVGLGRSDDDTIRRHALESGFTIVTKDADFAEYCLVRGAPPKVVWIRRGNCSTAEIHSLLRAHREAIAAFGESAEPLFRLL